VAVLLVPALAHAQVAADCDFDGSKAVGFADFLRLVEVFNTANATCDLDKDGSVGFADFLMFVQVYERASEAGTPAGVAFPRLLKALGNTGKAHLSVRRTGTGASYTEASVGDILALDVFIKGKGEQLTGAAVYLTFDDAYLELMPMGMQGSFPIPFRKGGWLDGTAYGNDTLHDVIGSSDGNDFPGFQLYYFESIPGTFSGQQRTAVGDGVLARLSLRVIGVPPGGTTAVRVDEGVAVAVGSETCYFVPHDPGTPYEFAEVRDFSLHILQPTTSRANVLATVLQQGVPRPATELALSRSISGKAFDYRWMGTTDSRGQARIVVVADEPQYWRVGATGYYAARALDSDGVVIGQWTSLALNGGKETVVTFEIPSRSDTTVSLPGGATMAMVHIPAGMFMMGSPDTEVGRGSDEGPQHEVTISKGVYLGKHEVTQGQWQAVMGTTPWLGESFGQPNANSPAVYVSWNDVQGFVQRLNDEAQDSVFRLPTEAEWEYACRAGTTTRLSFGDSDSDLKDHAWYRDNAWDVGERYAHQVGMKLPNPWGLYDMHGNVYEWCLDWYSGSYYSESSGADPKGPDSGSDRVVRGGDFGNYVQHLRSAHRGYASPDAATYIGFRLVREAK